MFRRSFRNASIQSKFRILVLEVSVLAVAASCGVFIAYLWISTRARTVTRQETMATIVADQSTAALEFDQAPQAATILSALKAEKLMTAAAIYNRQGKLFATYLNEGSPRESIPEHPGADGQRYEGGDLLNFHPILSGGERVGTLLPRRSMAAARER